MDEEVLFDNADSNEKSSASIEVVIENLPAEQANPKDMPLPQIDGQGIYDFEIDNMEEKPWEKPGADITDYFNYGFNEHSWKKYCAAQREVVKGAATNKKPRAEKLHKKGGERYGRKGERRVQDDRYVKKSEKKQTENEEHRYEERERRYERGRGKRDYNRDKRYDRRR